LLSGDGCSAASPESTAVKLRDLERRVDELKRQISERSRQAWLLRSSPVRLSLLNRMSNAFVLTKARFVVDGRQQYVLQVPGDSGAIADGESIPAPVDRLPFGDHKVEIDLTLRANDYRVLPYLRAYRFEVRSTHTFAVGRGRTLTMAAIASERGNVTTPLEERPAVAWHEVIDPPNAFLASARVGSAAASATEARLAQRGAAASNELGFDLYRQLSEAGPGNVMVSPASVALALSMAAEGARGETRAEMLRVLHVEGQADSATIFGALQASIRDRNGWEGVELHLANRLWVQRGLSLEASFESRLRLAFLASPAQVDFKGSPDAAHDAVDEWVSSETSGRIPGLPIQIDNRTRVVLANAIYFKGTWLRPFDPGATRESPFHTSKGDVNAPAMRHQGEFAYAEIANVELIDLPYIGGLSMLIALPREVDGLNAVERDLPRAYEGWVRALKASPTQMVELQLPKWHLALGESLNDTLRAMGMKRAFGETADFSGICAVRLSIADVAHAAFIDVYELGTEAAAATGVSLGLLSGYAGPVKAFRADHPFLFAIRDNETGSVLFLGRVVDPR
jgi:serpin B